MKTGQETLWYKQAIVYQVHVRAFCDSDGDGIGDFRGLTGKLDYIQKLGVTALWLLPFYPSPLKDDGYDIADYFSINPIYGTLADFRLFLREAHARGLRVITELVLNHTSDQHEWFQRSRRAPSGNPWRELYVWSDTPDKYRDARVIFKDFEASNWAWDPLARAYYWHRFYAHQPDLNFDSPRVHKAMLRVLDFWLDFGVDGLRLDAVPYLYEREGTSCENLPETHQTLKRLRAHVEEKYGERMLLAEANQWPEDAVAYFGQGRGDECHMAFHFPLMPRLFMAVRMEDRTPIMDILEQTPPIPETAQWALFLRNHDELTLEMVTDEERDYMYRVYAQDQRTRLNLGIRRRLAPLLDNDRKRIELLNALLMSLPGTPVLYYGDEIGMGDNIFLGDRDGVRTPMHWNADKNAGFSRANPQQLYTPIILDPEYHYETVNVETQEHNPNSRLWWMRRLLALRRRSKAFGQGTTEFLRPDNRKILAFIRRHEQESVLVVCNLSRFVQPVLLDLAACQQMTPVEMQGHTAFPPITNQPYFLTLGPHGFYWFNLMPPLQETSVSLAAKGAAEPPALWATRRWESLFEESARGQVEQALLLFLPGRLAAASRSKEAKVVRVGEVLPVPVPAGCILLVFAHVEFSEGDAEERLVPVGFATGAEMETLLKDTPHLVIGRVTLTDSAQAGVLYDASGNKLFARALLETMIRRRSLKMAQGELQGWCLAGSRQQRNELASLEPAPVAQDQRHTNIVFGKRLFLKLYRRVEAGVHPEVELNRFLTERCFPDAPALLGALEYHPVHGEPATLGVLHALLPNALTAWDFTLDTLGRFFDRVGSLPSEQSAPPPCADDILACAAQETPLLAQERLGTYVEAAHQLGECTARLHLALASAPDNPAFAPVPFTPNYQRSLYQSYRNRLVAAFVQLRRRAADLPEPVRQQAQAVLAAEPQILQHYRAIAGARLTGLRIRVHGDYCLPQLLHTGKAFAVIDFEGDSERPLSERRLKRSPLHDVASLLRSFHRAAYTALERHADAGPPAPESLARLQAWADFWTHWVGAIFLQSYLRTIGPGNLLSSDPVELRVLLRATLLNRLLLELNDPLTVRPEWQAVLLRGLLDLIEADDSATNNIPRP